MDLREGVAPPIQAQEPTHPTWQIVKIAGIFVLAGLGTYLVLTGPSYWQRFQYWLDHRGQTNSAEIYVDIDAAPDSFSGAVGAALRQPTFAKPDSQSDRVTAAQISSDLGIEDNHLVVPKISVKAPIIWNSSSEEQIMLANLQQGVAHYGFTQLPNETSGNVFLTGHSSYYWWDPGKYKTIFTLLDRLTTGDQAIIQYQGRIFVYQLTSKVVVKPTEVDVTNPTDTPQLSLMTCTPVGTSLNRLVAKFDLARVYAADGTAGEPSVTEPSNSTNPDPLPGQQVPRDRDAIRLIPGLQ